MNKATFILAFALLISCNAISQKNLNVTPRAKLIEEVKKKGNEIVIPYKKYVLPNGLTVIIHEDHSDPVVYVDVTYHVGSAREQEGRSGFAHFFEHMMFQGSKHVGDEMHFKYIEEAGGSLNGSTNTDRTNYFETAPNNQLEMMLWLESDRMGFLLDSVTHSKFEVQRATVKNERGQRYDNAPYGLVGEKIGEALYPKGHPYSWSTIGYIADLDRVDENDLKRFYMRWYGPNNAALTISGDVKSDSAIKMVEKYFGSIPRGPAVKKQIVKPFALDKDRYISYEDKVKFPLVRMSWPTVPLGHKDEAALDGLSFILSPGNLSSPFYEKLIKTQKAVAANVSSYSQELGGKFEINLRALEGDSLAKMEKEIRNILTEWEKKGVTDDDLLKLKASVKSSTYDGLTTAQGKGARLARYQTFEGNPNGIGKEVKKITDLTKEDIMRAYKTYVKSKPCVILSCVPVGKKELIAREDNFKNPERTIEKESAEYKGLSYKEPKDNFDRRVKPAAGSNPVIIVPEIWKEDMDNGLKLIGTTTTEIPKVNVQISIGAGHRFEVPSKAGESKLLARLLDESTSAHSAEELETILDKMGSSISIYSDDDNITMYISSLKENFAATMKIAEEKIFKNKWDPVEFDRVKKELLNSIKSQSVQPVAIASNVYSKILYGKGHIMSLPGTGTAETTGSITMAELKNFYSNRFFPGISKVVVVGDITKNELMEQVKFLQNWKNDKVVKLPDPEIPKIDKTKIYFVDKKGAAQSEVRIGFMSMPYDATGDFFKAHIVNFPLAGNFNSRINNKLREVRGYTYGTSGNFYGDMFPGPYTINGGIRANATDTAMMDYLGLMKTYIDNGITPEELSFTKKAMGQSEALKYEGPYQKAGFLKRLLDYNLDRNYTQQQNEILASITKEEIDALAKKYIPIGNMNIVIVGDKASLFERIKNLGYDVVELDLNGEPVK